MNNASNKPPARFLGWRMVLLACLCINLGVGFTFGAYSTFMPSMIAEFSASHSLASGGLSLLVAMVGVCAPAAGYAIGHWSIRATLMAGCLLMSAGWGVVGIAANAWHFILGFGILCGAGAAALMGVPTMTLINNWFITLRGRAIGIATVAILLTVVPSLAATGITTFGWRATALTISAVALLFTPFMLLVIDHPESIGQTPLGADSVGATGSEMKIANGVHGSSLLVYPVFWMLLLSGGLCGAAGVALIAHLVPFSLWRGLDLGDAASLVSILGAAALFGGLIGGVVVDRIGGARTFVILALTQFIAWPSLLLSHGYYFYAVCVAAIGLCGNAMQPAMIALVINSFGRERFAQAMGLLQMCTTPLSIALPLLAGALYDWSGSYREVFIVYPVLFGISGAASCLVSRIEARRKAATNVPAIALGS